MAVTKKEQPILESWKKRSCIKLPHSEELNNRLQPSLHLIMETPSVRQPHLSLSLSLIKTKKAHNLFLSLAGQGQEYTTL
jgi:hypothetical protein